MTDWSQALQEMRCLEPRFYWRLLYQDRPFIDELRRRIDQRIRKSMRKACLKKR
jgi:hypothetical protein